MRSNLFVRAAVVAAIVVLFYVGAGLREPREIPGLVGTAAAADEVKPAKKIVRWQSLLSDGRGEQLERAKVPGGWLVKVIKVGGSAAESSIAVTFLPDADHKWDGASE